MYATELNSWSLAYHLGNARFRLVEVHAFLAKNDKTAELDELMKHFNSSFSHVLDPPRHWVACFHAMRLILDFLEAN